jgi:hypothetical protein
VSDLETLNSRIAEVVATNWGGESRPLWLDVELDADEAWRIYLMHRDAEALAPLHAELIYRGEGQAELETFLRHLEEYGDGASLFIEISRNDFLTDLAASISSREYPDAKDGDTFSLMFDCWRFEAIPHYTLTRSDAYDGDHPSAGFLTIAEAEAFVAKLDADPEAAYDHIQSSADDYMAAISAGWGAYVPGELRRRRRSADLAKRRAALDAEIDASMARHPAGKGRRAPQRIGELIDFPMGRLENGGAVVTPIRSIFPESHRPEQGA